MRAAVDSRRNPLFADLLRGIHLRNSFYYRPELRAPWGFSVAHHGTVFHIVASGSCSLQVKGAAKPLPLSAGDFVVVTRGDAHAMRDPPATPTVNFFDLAERHPPDNNRVFRAGGEGPATRLVCGGMQFQNAATNPLLAVLPPLLHVKRTEEGARHWLRLTVEHILAELDSGGAGATEIVIRLAEILFIEAVRTYFEENADTAEFGWLAAVRDQQIGQALALLHSHPHQPWTVASLARRLAVSRSAFAARFTELVGEPPFRYLTRLRISAAAARLRMSDDKLSSIATSAGYDSVAALAKAFKRHMGMTPGEYRQACLKGRSA
jgi:AraC-like DNA-binding protein/mannose-6-phosphate isomerase-like protein (cupin superfamily)